jgi:hypothetical protein
MLLVEERGFLCLVSALSVDEGIQRLFASSASSNSSATSSCAANNVAFERA